MCVFCLGWGWLSHFWDDWGFTKGGKYDHRVLSRFYQIPRGNSRVETVRELTDGELLT